MRKNQLDREIDQAMAVGGNAASGTRTRDAGLRFQELLRDAHPDAMRVAEDVLLESGWKLREVTGGMRARNFTIEMNPMWRPREQWKMVQANAESLQSKPGKVWVKWSVANGAARAYREREIKSDIDDAKRFVVATAWAIAKAIKAMPLDASEDLLAKTVDKIIARGKKNMVPVELF